MLGTFKTIVGILFNKEPEKPKNIVITLDELCQIWLPYNNSFQPPPDDPPPAPQVAAGGEGALPPGETAKEPPSHTPPESTPSGPEAGRKMIDLNRFYDEVIEPLRDSFISQGLLDAVNRIVDLLNRHGDCPSIVTEGFDSGSEDGSYIREALQKVNLRDHTFRVVKNAVALMKEAYSDGTGMAPVTIITALCHDIGKIPKLREEEGGGLAKNDHPVTSVKYVEKLLKEEISSQLLDLIVKAVRDHHNTSADQFTLLLKEADVKARASEVAENSRNRALEWSGWFDPKELLALIKPHVNMIQTGKLFKAFSFEGAVYCDSSFIYEMAGRLAMEKKVIDLTLTRDSERDTALRRIVESLREGNCLSSELGRGYISRRYSVQQDHSKQSMYFIPIMLDAFDKPEEIEEVKKTYPPVIRGIKPL